MGLGTVFAAFFAGVICTLALQAWRAKATGSTTIGPVVSALVLAAGSPAVTSAQVFIDAAWLKFMSDVKATIDKEFTAAQVPTLPTPTITPTPGA